MVKQFRTVAKGSKKPGLATPLRVGAATGNVGRGAVIGRGIGVKSEVMGGIELASGTGWSVLPGNAPLRSETQST